jgi:hypothetical protein
VTERATLRASVASLATAFVLLGVGIVLFGLSRGAGYGSGIFSWADLVQSLALPVAFLLVAAVIMARRPGNSIGWLCLLTGFWGSLTWAGLQYSGYVLVTRPGSLAGKGSGVAVAVASNNAYAPVLGLLILTVLVFPTGCLISPRWRPIAWLTVGAFAGSFTVGALSALNAPFQHYANPIAVTGGGAGAAVFIGAVVLSWLAGVVGAFVSAVVRFRRSRREERAQLKWLALAASILPIGVVVHTFAESFAPGALNLVETVFSICLAGIPVAIGIAILRYRLYEIDRLISRTLAYLIITGLLVSVFVGMVVLATDVLPFSSPVAVAASTLTAAALFNPLREQVQHLVDRRFNRSRYDADTIVTSFATRLREAVDVDIIRRELLHAVGQAVEPAHASLWIRPPAERPGA